MIMSRTISESAGTFYMGKNLKMDESLYLENQIAEKKRKEDEENLAKMLLEASKEKQREIDEKISKLEFLPMWSRVVLLAYPENPYKKIMEGNIIVDYNGEFLNPDSGEMDRMPPGVACAKVIEVGPKCEYLKPGDDVYYDNRTVQPIPFMNMGYITTHEQSIIAVINEGLKERFKMS